MFNYLDTIVIKHLKMGHKIVDFYLKFTMKAKNVIKTLVVLTKHVNL